MLSWITGPRAGQAEGEIPDTTSAEVPETPAHLFAVRAFKQAFFGTPQPVTPFIPKLNGAKFQHTATTSSFVSTSSTNDPSANSKPNPAGPVPRNGRIKSLKVQEDRKAKSQLFGTRTDATSASSPTKPAGILMTPGTAAGRRKQVTFGEKVVDNEGKSKSYSTSGLPDDYPGKFPSPFTPKMVISATPNAQVEGKATGVEKILDSRFKSALDSAINGKVTVGNPKKQIVAATASTQGSIQRSRDDGDITLDMSLPQSASGRYWKEHYEIYSTRSEAELNRLIVKHRIAKDYARMKDEEVTAFKAQLETDRRNRQDRERGLESQIRDLRERLRMAMADNASMSAELALLRASGGLDVADRAIKSDKVERHELLVEGFRDVEIPIGTRKHSGSMRGVLEPVKVESSGQDIWLDNNASADLRRPTKKLVKPSSDLFATTPRTQSLRSSNNFSEAPLSSRIIRERLANPVLSARSANIVNKLPPPSGIEDPQDILKGLASVHASTPMAGAARGRSPRSGDKRSGAGASIDDKRKDSAVARIEARRRNKRGPKQTQKSSALS